MNNLKLNNLLNNSYLLADNSANSSNPLQITKAHQNKLNNYISKIPNKAAKQEITRIIKNLYKYSPIS